MLNVSFVIELKMRTHFVDCFMLMGTALSLRGDQQLPEMGRPLLQDVFTTTVNISITLSQIYFENVNAMEVRFTFLLHQRWLDPRLGANQRTRKLAVNGQIWRPHLTATEGDAYVKENDMTQYWRGLGPEGKILYSEKVTVKTFCTSNFRKFPFDSQKCAIKLGSYRFPKEEVELMWNKVPIEILTGTDLNEFKLTDVNTYSEVEVRPSGNFTVLVAQITVKRFYEHYIFCTIAPCSLMVVLSYFVFWLDPRNITIRYFLSTVNLCLLIYYYHSAVCATRPVPYMKALDVFIAICSSFVLMGLLENIAIDIIFRKEDFEAYGASRIFHKRAKLGYGTRYKLIDRIACAMYPIIFTCVMLFFCIMYVA